MKFDLNFMLDTKINSKMDHEFKCKTITLLEENVGKSL